MEEEKDKAGEEEKDKAGEEKKEIIGPTSEQLDIRFLSRKFDDRPFNNVGVEPIDGDDPCIYSQKILAGPYSFMDLEKIKPNPKMPAPTYIKEEDIPYNMKFTSEDILQGLTIAKEGGLVCTDKEIIKRQKGILVSFLGKVLKCVFQGGSFVSISLPVKVFEGRSTVDKIVDAWRLAPSFLPKAADLKDPVQRMKDVISFAISGLYCSITQLKPFNPILGETFEGGLDDGTKIFLEHTSHHPPISTFFIEGVDKKYYMSGRYQYKVKFSPNSLTCFPAGKTTIRFHDGHVIKYKMPSLKISGLVFGSRMTSMMNAMTFYDTENSIKAVIIFDYGYTGGWFSSRKKGCKRDDFEGIIYKWDQEKPKIKTLKKLADLKDVKEKLCTITGNWISHLKFDSEEVWNIKTSKPSAIWYSPSPLPSDWRYREDLIWLRRNDIPKADLWKLELEVQQRFDRAQREKGAKLRSKA